jgi:hypothetical protein
MRDAYYDSLIDRKNARVEPPNAQAQARGATPQLVDRAELQHTSELENIK